MGATWPQFLTQCRAQLGSGTATAVPTPASAQPQTGSLFPWQTPAAPAPAPTTSTITGNQSVMKQCGAQWHAERWSLTRAALGKISGTAAKLRRPLPQLPLRLRADLRQQRRPLRLRQPRHNRVHCFRGSGRQLHPLEAPRRPEADLRRRSKLSIVVPDQLSFGSNEHSHIYHFPGTRDYGHTKSGAYMCEAEAQSDFW
jgi:hypothetical protein